MLRQRRLVFGRIPGVAAEAGLDGSDILQVLSNT